MKKKIQNKKDKKKFKTMFDKKQIRNLTNFIDEYYLTHQQLIKLLTSDFVYSEVRWIDNDKPTNVTSYLKIYNKKYLINSKQWLTNEGTKYIFEKNIKELV